MSTVIITGSATLRVLDVGYNDIGDDGMAVISEALQHNKFFTTLWVEQCGLSVKGTLLIVNNEIFDRINNYISLFAKFMQLVKGGWFTLSTVRNIFTKRYSCWLTDIGMAISG